MEPDGFFGEDFRSLGAGVTEEGLLEYDSEDDLDAFNDETFGGPLEVGGDWEQNHEQLAKLEELEFGGDTDFDLTEKPTMKEAISRQLDLGPIDVVSSVLDSPEAQQRDLEASISQLVLENDDPDDSFEDPAIVKQPQSSIAASVAQVTEPTAHHLAAMHDVGFQLPGTEVMASMLPDQVVRGGGIPPGFPSSVGLQQLQHQHQHLMQQSKQQQQHPQHPLQMPTPQSPLMLSPGGISTAQAEAAMQHQQQLYQLHQQRLHQMELEKQPQPQQQFDQSKVATPTDLQQNATQHLLLQQQQQQHQQMLLHPQRLHQLQLEQLQLHQLHQLHLQQQQLQQQQPQPHPAQPQQLPTTPTKTAPPPPAGVLPSFPYRMPQPPQQLPMSQMMQPQLIPHASGPRLQQPRSQLPAAMLASPTGGVGGVPLPPPPIPLPNNQKPSGQVPQVNDGGISDAEGRGGGTPMDLNQLLMKVALQQNQQQQAPAAVERPKVAPPELDDPSIVNSSVLKGFKFASDLEDEMFQPDNEPQKQDQRPPQSQQPPPQLQQSQQPPSHSPPLPQIQSQPQQQQPRPQPEEGPRTPHKSQLHSEAQSAKLSSGDLPKHPETPKKEDPSKEGNKEAAENQSAEANAKGKNHKQQPHQQRPPNGMVGGPFPPPPPHMGPPGPIPPGFFPGNPHLAGIRPPGMPPPGHPHHPHHPPHHHHIPPGMPPPGPMSHYPLHPHHRPGFPLAPGANGFPPPFGPPPPPARQRGDSQSGPHQGGPGGSTSSKQTGSGGQQHHSEGGLSSSALVPPHLQNKEILRQHHESLLRGGSSDNNNSINAAKHIVPPSPKRNDPQQQQRHEQFHHRDQRRHGGGWGDGRHGNNNNVGNNQRNMYNNSNVGNQRGQQHHHNNANHNDSRVHNGHNRNLHNNNNNGQAPKDEYQLMTQKEKDWVIRIQLLQLQTDDPYTDDYYYTTFVMRKLAEEMQKKNASEAATVETLERQAEDGGGEEELKVLGERQTSAEGASKSTEEPKLLLPPRVTLENRSYIPVKFENSLGRITSSSVHNPRVLIDVGCRRSTITSESEEGEEEEGGANSDTSVRENQERFRQLLMSIEDLYMVVLAIDELGKAVLALPEEKRATLYQERDAMIQVLYSRILYSPPGTNERPSFALLTLSSIRKGKKLVGRSIPLFSLKRQQAVLLAIMDELPFLLKRDTGDKIFPREVLPHLRDTVDESSLKALLAFAKTYLKHPPASLNSIVASEFGLALILCFFHRAETIFHAADEKAKRENDADKTAPVKDPDAAVRTAWRGVAQNIAAAMEVLREKKTATGPSTAAAKIGAASSSSVGGALKDSAIKHLKRILVEDAELAADLQREIDSVFPSSNDELCGGTRSESTDTSNSS